MGRKPLQHLDNNEEVASSIDYLMSPSPVAADGSITASLGLLTTSLNHSEGPGRPAGRMCALTGSKVQEVLEAIDLLEGVYFQPFNKKTVTAK